jgi:hypothetical protein
MLVCWEFEEMWTILLFNDVRLAVKNENDNIELVVDELVK